MARERIQTRADADTLEQVEEYAEDKDISYSEAVRRLVRTGLIQKGYREAEADGDDDDPELAEAHMNERARQSGSIIMILMLAFLVAAEVGLL